MVCRQLLELSRFLSRDSSHGGSGAKERGACYTEGMNFPDTDPRGWFTHCHFDSAIIIQCVRGYLTYQLSYRALVAIKAERSVDVAHTTILT